MILGRRIALISDVHGEHRLLGDVLSHCHDDKVEQVVLLGDLFDRLDQAEACARHLSGWRVTGVIGNHEREALGTSGRHGHGTSEVAERLLQALDERLEIEDVMFVHDDFGWKPNGHGLSESNGHRRTWITFAGHTHYRSARDDNGPIDLTIGRIHLRRERRYLINPGAVVEGQFAIWDRQRSQVTFHRV